MANILEDFLSKWTCKFCVSLRPSIGKQPLNLQVANNFCTSDYYWLVFKYVMRCSHQINCWLTSYSTVKQLRNDDF